MKMQTFYILRVYLEIWLYEKNHVILTDIFEIYAMFHDNRIDQWLLRTPDVLKYFPSFWFGYFHFWNKNKAKTRKKMLFVLK